MSTFETSRATLSLGGRSVTIEQQSGFPRRGESVLALRLDQPCTFAIKFRVPEWAKPLTIAGASEQAGWAVIPARLWHDGHHVPVSFNLSSRIILGEHSNAGQAALAWGPFILAYEQGANPSLPSANEVGVAGPGELLASSAQEPLRFSAPVVGSATAAPSMATFFTFADAGAEYGVYRVWLRASGVAVPPG